MDGNLLCPMNWAGVLLRPDDVPIPRMVRGETTVGALVAGGAPMELPSTAWIASYSPEGVVLPPLFTPLWDPEDPNTATLFGSVDAVRGVMRIARKACVGGTREGQSCADSGDCSGGGTCEGPKFDFQSRYAEGVGPVVVEATEYEANAENPVPIEGLIQGDQVFSFVVSEGIDGIDVNGDGDGCDSNCTITACGNGIVTGTEQCDDGNLIDADGCQADCTVASVGLSYCSGKRLVVQDKNREGETDGYLKRKIVVLSKDESRIGAPGLSPVLEGATLVIQNNAPSPTGDAQIFELAPGEFSSAAGFGWKALGNPPGSKGYKYLDPKTTQGPCKLVLIKPGKLLRAVCLNRLNPPTPITYTLNEDDQEAISVRLTIGNTGYCMVYENSPPGALRADRGTTEKPTGVGVFKVVEAATPGSCPID